MDIIWYYLWPNSAALKLCNQKYVNTYLISNFPFWSQNFPEYFIYVVNISLLTKFIRKVAQSAGAVEYTDCISAER